MSKLKRISGIILRVEDEVLLCQRSPGKSLPLEWSIPSGHIDKGEKPIDAAMREFKEETDIDISPKLDLVGILNTYKNKKKKKLIFVYSSKSKDKLIPDLTKAKDGHEHTQCKYFNEKNLPISRNNKNLMDIVKNVLK